MENIENRIFLGITSIDLNGVMFCSIRDDPGIDEESTLDFLCKLNQLVFSNDIDYSVLLIKKIVSLGSVRLFSIRGNIYLEKDIADHSTIINGKKIHFTAPHEIIGYGDDLHEMCEKIFYQYSRNSLGIYANTSTSICSKIKESRFKKSSKQILICAGSIHEGHKIEVYK